MSIYMSRSHKLLAGVAAAALLIGGTAGIDAQAADPALPPLPPAATATSAPAMPLGHDEVREVQNQLISLGFDPGPADGEAGPGTIAAAQQYDKARGGAGTASVDSALLARLKADTAPRLTYEQVAERAQTRHAVQASAPAPAASGASQIGGIVQQIAPLLGAAIASSNNNNYGPGYYGPGPNYYGPPPGYYHQGYYYGGF